MCSAMLLKRFLVGCSLSGVRVGGLVGSGTGYEWELGRNQKLSKRIITRYLGLIDD